MARVEVSGIAGSSRSSLLAALKEHYFPKWRDAVNEEQTLNGLVNGSNKGTLAGRQGKLYHHFADVPSAGIALFENDDLPTPQGSQSLQGNLHARDIYCRVRLTGQIKRSTKMSSYVKGWQRELTSARRRHNKNLNRMLYLGPRQPLATVSAESTSTLTLYGRDTRTSGGDDFWKFGTLFLYEGMPIVGIDANAASPVPYGALATGAVRYIKSIDEANQQIVITDGADYANTAAAAFATPLSTNADGALLVPFGRQTPATAITPGTDSDSRFSGINGLFNVIGDSTIDSYIYDLARATYPSLSGTVNDNGVSGTRALSDQLIDLQIDSQMENRFNGGQDVDSLLMSRHNRRTYVATTEGDRRYKPVQTSRGYGQLQYTTGDRPKDILTDRECPPGIIFALAKSTMGRYEQMPFGYADDGDNFRFVANKDAHEAVMVESFNFACTNVAANGWLDDLEYDTNGAVTIT